MCMVLFNYKGDSERSLDGVSIALQAGQTVGLVGCNACGKSTLARAQIKIIWAPAAPAAARNTARAWAGQPASGCDGDRVPAPKVVDLRRRSAARSAGATDTATS